MFYGSVTLVLVINVIFLCFLCRYYRIVWYLSAVDPKVASVTKERKKFLARRKMMSYSCIKSIRDKPRGSVRFLHLQAVAKSKLPVSQRLGTDLALYLTRNATALDMM